MVEGSEVSIWRDQSDEVVTAVLATQVFGGLPRARVQGIPWRIKTLKPGQEVVYSGQDNSAGVVLAGTCWVMTCKPRGYPLYQVQLEHQVLPVVSLYTNIHPSAIVKLYSVNIMELISRIEDSSLERPQMGGFSHDD